MKARDNIQIMHNGTELSDIELNALGIKIEMPKLVVTVEHYEGTFTVESVWSAYDWGEWSVQKMKERGLLLDFKTREELKETLNWNLNGNEKKYKLKPTDITMIDGKKKTTYSAFIYE